MTPQERARRQEQVLVQVLVQEREPERVKAQQQLVPEREPEPVQAQQQLVPEQAPRRRHRPHR